MSSGNDGQERDQELEQAVPAAWQVEDQELADNIKDYLEQLEQHAWYVRSGGKIKAVLVDAEAFLQIFELRNQASIMDELKKRMDQGEPPVIRRSKGPEEVAPDRRLDRPRDPE